MAFGEGEDDDGDPAMPLPGAKQHLSSSDLFSVSLNSSSTVSSQDCPASSTHFGHHLNMVEDILRKYQEVGQRGDYNGVIDGVSLLLDTLWASFTDRQPIFHASSQPHGHLGRKVADHEGELGQQGEVVPIQGAVGSSKVWVWGVTECGGALAGFILASVSAIAGSEQQDFQASYKILGHSGSLVSGEPVVGEHCFWGEYTDGVSTRGVGNCGLGQGDDRVQVV